MNARRFVSSFAVIGAAAVLAGGSVRATTCLDPGGVEPPLTSGALNAATAANQAANRVDTCVCAGKPVTAGTKLYSRPDRLDRDRAFPGDTIRYAVITKIISAGTDASCWAGYDTYGSREFNKTWVAPGTSDKKTKKDVRLGGGGNPGRICELYTHVDPDPIGSGQIQARLRSDGDVKDKGKDRSKLKNVDSGKVNASARPVAEEEDDLVTADNNADVQKGVADITARSEKRAADAEQNPLADQLQNLPPGVGLGAYNPGTSLRPTPGAAPVIGSIAPGEWLQLTKKQNWMVGKKKVKLGKGAQGQVIGKSGFNQVRVRFVGKKKSVLRFIATLGLSLSRLSDLAEILDYQPHGELYTVDLDIELDPLAVRKIPPPAELTMPW